MNLIGHNYIAKLLLERYNPLIAAGCHLPDMVPFLKDSVLTFDEIHENPEAVYKYLLNTHKKEELDLALGLMTHSVKFGVDEYNKNIDKWLLNDDNITKNKIAEKIVIASSVNLEIAQSTRMHGYLWSGLDFYILEKYPEFISEINDAYKKVNVGKVSEILSESFKKPYDDIYKNVKNHLGLVVNNPVKTKMDFVIFWKEFISDLPEKDELNVKEAYDLVNFIEKEFHDRWESIINKSVLGVKSKMSAFLALK